MGLKMGVTEGVKSTGILGVGKERPRFWQARRWVVPRRVQRHFPSGGLHSGRTALQSCSQVLMLQKASVNPPLAHPHPDRPRLLRIASEHRSFCC